MGSDSESLGAVDLMQNSLVRANVTGLAVLIMLFGLLLLASHSNELLRQIVITPGSSADLGVEAACREDELEEEQLSLQECRLMVVDVQIILSSSPAWFRPYQMTLSSFGIAAALFSIVTAFGLINRQSPSFRSVAVSMGILLLVELAGFLAAVNTGPLLRARYLWPLLLWFVVHPCVLVAAIRLAQQQGEVGSE